MSGTIPPTKEGRMELLTSSCSALLSAMGGLLRHASSSSNEARAAVDEARMRAIAAQMTSQGDNLMRLIAQLKLEAVLREAKEREQTSAAAVASDTQPASNR